MQQKHNLYLTLQGLLVKDTCSLTTKGKIDVSYISGVKEIKRLHLASLSVRKH